MALSIGGRGRVPEKVRRKRLFGQTVARNRSRRNTGLVKTLHRMTLGALGGLALVCSPIGISRGQRSEAPRIRALLDSFFTARDDQRWEDAASFLDRRMLDSWLAADPLYGSSIQGSAPIQ